MAGNSTDRRVVVTGLGVVTPLGQDPDSLWQNLLASKCGVGPITLFDSEPFATHIAAEVKDFDASGAFPSPSRGS